MDEKAAENRCGFPMRLERGNFLDVGTRREATAQAKLRRRITANPDTVKHVTHTCVVKFCKSISAVKYPRYSGQLPSSKNTLRLPCIKSHYLKFVSSKVLGFESRVRSEFFSRIIRDTSASHPYNSTRKLIRVQI